MDDKPVGIIPQYWFLRAQEETSGTYPGVFLDPMTPEVLFEIHLYLVSNPEIVSDPVSVTFRRQP